MENTWSYHNPVKITFGCGTRSSLLEAIKGLKILTVTTSRGRKFIEKDPILKELSKKTEWVDSISRNPDLNLIQNEINRFSGNFFDLIIAFGGGSSIDAAKALSCGLSPDICSRDILKLIIDPQKYLNKKLIPIYALPTTSGTGSEVTPFATIWDYANQKKLSLTHARIFPKIAIIDPELTYDLPKDSTISCGLDALNQAFESIWNKNSCPLTNSMAARSIKKAINAIPRLNHNIQDHDARELIAESSLLAGLSISHTRTAICHSISYPLTAHFGINHGIACAFTMFSVAKKVNKFAPAYLEEIAKLNNFKSSDELVEKIGYLTKILEVKNIVKQSIPNNFKISVLIEEMITPGRSDNFILKVDKEFIKEVLEDSLI